jgi:RNA polymerase sigma-70 factor (ECF subfamily)
MDPTTRACVPTLNAPDRHPRESIPDGVVRQLPSVRDSNRLLEGLRAGEPWAKGTLFEQYGPQVQRQLREILGPQPNVELPDLIHDVFVAALASIHQLRHAFALRSWMHSMTVRTAVRALRQQRMRRWLKFWAPLEATRLMAKGVNADVIDAYQRVYAVLDRVPVAERIVFALRYIDGMELAVIAVACEVSLSTAKRRLSKADQRFATAAQRDEVLRTWLPQGNRWTTQALAGPHPAHRDRP